ncbi:DUF721 domain-containing protein [Apibacter muscae]|uniref:DUF721 domain-containing protein n=1 Tax=Apibacter muscae TaxID=2509004 RepID=A0A563DG34_9FLAO|nr:DUF721 domain-containing protein [Apibacter muscae]TWP29087.1 DUF721 domain-containing protein [Apibacter muscae]TWP30332.1 DUF721 domain-containing protein [Apibacter muscae]
MSIRRKEQTSNSAIKNLIKVLGIEEKLLIVEIQNLWRELMGPSIFEHTTRMFIDNEILYIQIDSAVIRNELNFNQEKLYNEINKAIAQNRFSKIKFI